MFFPNSFKLINTYFTKRQAASYPPAPGQIQYIISLKFN